MSLTFQTSSPGSLDLNSIKELFKTCNWNWLEPDSEMTLAFHNSFRIFQVDVDGQLIGFARVISDGKIYGLLVDLMIAPDYRGKGYGQQLASFILDRCRQDGLKVIQLLSSREGKKTYLKSGFTQCPDDSPGMIQFLL